MDKKIVNPQAAAHTHGGCGHTFYGIPPRDFSPRNGSTHYAPPAHVADVQFHALTHAFIYREVPTNLNFVVLQLERFILYRYTFPQFTKITRNYVAF